MVTKRDMYSPTRWTSFAIILYLALGIIWIGKPLLKTEIGPLYLAEAFFLAWFVSLGPFQWRDLFLTGLKSLKPIILFFLWGFILFLFDLKDLSNLGSFEKMRTFQHGIIFVYPLMWSAVGLWLTLQKDFKPMLLALSALIVASVSLPNFFGQCIHNISLGPVIYGLGYYLLTLKKKKWRFFALPIFFFAHLPFWVMWWIQITQRTTFLNAAIGMTLTPALLVWAGKWNFKKAYKAALLVWGTFLFGILMASLKPVWEKIDWSIPLWKNHGDFSASSILRHSLYATQKPDDLPDEGTGKSFYQGRYRSFLWKQAILDWRAGSLLAGLRFIPEVPSRNNPSNLNLSSSEYPGAPPVSGPHNSFLSVLARMGLIGFGLFFLILNQVAWRGLRILRDESETALFPAILLGVLVITFGLVHALFNIGFEAPHNIILLWVFVGVLLGWPARVNKTNLV